MQFITALDPRGHFDVVFIDSGAGIGDNVLFFVGAAQEAILVVNPEPTSLIDAYAVVKVCRSRPACGPSASSSTRWSTSWRRGDLPKADHGHQPLPEGAHAPPGLHPARRELPSGHHGPAPAGRDVPELAGQPRARGHRDAAAGRSARHPSGQRAQGHVAALAARSRRHLLVDACNRRALATYASATTDADDADPALRAAHRPRGAPDRDPHRAQERLRRPVVGGRARPAGGGAALRRRPRGHASRPSSSIASAAPCWTSCAAWTTCRAGCVRAPTTCRR